MHQRIYKSGTPPARAQSFSLAPRSSSVREQEDCLRPPLQEHTEDEAFRQDKFESFGLQLKEKNGTITSGDQERLGVLQAKMNSFWTQRLEGASRLGYNFAHISADSEGASPISPVIQREVKEHLVGNKTYYVSSYEQNVKKSNISLYETEEEAREADNNYKNIWERSQGEGSQRMPPEKKEGKEEKEEKEEKSESGGPGLEADQSSVHIVPNLESGKSIVPIRQGLIRGSYDKKKNEADLHVDAAKDDKRLTADDMLMVAEFLEQEMRLRQKEGGPRGRFLLHPTGAAIVKIVTELLGEALGGLGNKLLARVSKSWRGKIATDKKADKLNPKILPEHFHYLDSLRGTNKVSIIPRIVSGKEAYKQTEEDFNQDMMVKTEQGEAKYKKYKAHAEDPSEEMGAGLDITIYADQLPDIISVLRKAKGKK